MQLAGAFWVHRPKSLLVSILPILVAKGASGFCVGKVPPADFDYLRGQGCFVCCSVAPFRCRGRLVVLVAFLGLVRN